MKDEIVLNLLERDFDSLTDIEKIDGQFGDTYDCPVARAFKRQFPDQLLTVGLHTVTTKDYIEYIPVGVGIGVADIRKFAKKLQKQSKVIIRLKRS